MRLARLRALLAAAAASIAAGEASAQGSYVNFESPQVHPIRLSPDGTRLFAANTADNRLSVFDVSNASNPILIAEIPVGLEPVSVNPRSNDEVWVVNHTSDSVSVVSVSQGIVTDTIPVKDEPCDVVFAGTPQRAFVSASRSNQVRAIDLTTHAIVGTVTLQGLNPRALAVSPDGSRVYAAFALSGNRTTTVPKQVAPPQGPPTNPNLPPPPPVARIVDATDPAWSPSVIQYTVLDHDVAEINANTVSLNRYFDRTGTVNFNLAVNPVSGDVWVANTDARNLIRFETALRGHFVDNRVTRVTTGALPSITAVDLNPGINYAVLPNPAALATALAQPTDLVFEPSGSAMWVAAFGTDRVAKLDGAGNVISRIEVGDVTGAAIDPIHKRGPRGLALKASASRLYVQNKLSNTVTVIDTAAGAVVQEVPVGSYDPTPAVIKNGRGFLYDAKLSGNGTGSCAGCHIDGDTDLLAWDLGNPGGTMVQVVDPELGAVFNLHPMKGPMITQHLKNMAGIPPYHWRGDKPSLNAFNGAFDSLMGGSQLAAADMQRFSDFMDTMRLEPNPNQNLDRSLPNAVPGAPGNPNIGQNQYFGPPPGGGCAGCHKPPLNYTVRVAVEPGFPGAVPGKSTPLRDFFRRLGFSRAPGAQNLTGVGFHNDGAGPPVLPGQPPDLIAFMACFDTLMAPAVGWGQTIRQNNATSAVIVNQLNTVLARAAIGDCDVIAKGRIDGVLMGLRYQPAGALFLTDKLGVGPFSWPQLQAKAIAGNAQFTVMGVPPGSGNRIGVDRDLDGTLDGDEPTAPHVVTYGASTAGCAGPLAIGVNSQPFLGNATFALTCTNTPASTLGLGLVGNVQDLAGTAVAGIALHVSLLSTEILVLDTFSDSSGFGVCPAPLPTTSALAGLTYCAQILWIDGCAPQGLSASNAAAMTLFAP
ncbi:MAG: beta-propeller fold lactonase family protein [Planctomycetes bacterium]|nr:beta-propeller fold lactonase family protein [Planctomycetota bacterium]